MFVSITSLLPNTVLTSLFVKENIFLPEKTIVFMFLSVVKSLFIETILLYTATNF